MNAYKDVYPLFTTKKAGQLQGIFVFYCVVTVCNVGYVCSFRRDQIFMDFVSFLCMDNFMKFYIHDV